MDTALVAARDDLHAAARLVATARAVSWTGDAADAFRDRVDQVTGALATLVVLVDHLAVLPAHAGGLAAPGGWP